MFRRLGVSCVCQPSAQAIVLDGYTTTASHLALGTISCNTSWLSLLFGAQHTIPFASLAVPR